jgi:hypothetical protein
VRTARRGAAALASAFFDAGLSVAIGEGGGSLAGELAAGEGTTDPIA